MTEAKHTPAPWRKGQWGNNRVYGFDGMGEHSGLIAVVFKGRANARLIAAAPDMLETLKTVRDYVSDASKANLVWPDGYNDALTEMATGDLARIDAAIARATGEAKP